MVALRGASLNSLKLSKSVGGYQICWDLQDSL